MAVVREAAFLNCHAPDNIATVKENGNLITYVFRSVSGTFKGRRVNGFDFSNKIK